VFNRFNQLRKALGPSQPKLSHWVHDWALLVPIERGVRD
jgi:hypothetical protein